jgi:drug/metabolite transporter (DMT)-like permease
MAAVALGLASSLAWGFADFFGGLQSRRRPLLAVLVVTQTAGFALAIVIVALRAEGPPAMGSWLAWAAGGSLFGLAGLAAFYRGLATGNMGVVAPISSAAAVIPLIVGLASGERPGAVQAVGVALAIAGVVLASREQSEMDAGRRVAAGAGLAIVAAIGFGSFFVAMDRASDADALWAILVARAASVALLWPIALATRTQIPRAASDLKLLVPIGLLDTTANLLYALATTQGLLSIVAVLASVYPVVTVLLARFVLHERLHVIQRVGAVGALAGAALISSGA